MNLTKKMWTVIKYKKKNFNILKKELNNKLGSNLKFYRPKLKIKKFSKNNLDEKKIEIDLLDNYFFCYHEKFKEMHNLKYLNFTKGLEYFLDGYKKSQNEISKFIERCKNSEHQGYVTQKFFEIRNHSDYKFYNGPFIKNIFKVLEIKKNKIRILIKNIEIILDKRKYLYY